MPAKGYIPVSCELYDELTLLSLRKTPCSLKFMDAAGLTTLERVKITDIETAPDGEYLVLHTGEKIRLDKINAIHAIESP